MRLNNLQNGFKEHLSQKRNRAEAEFRSLFKDSDISVEERLNIYQNNLFVSLQRVLLARHELLEIIVGPEFLNLLVKSYVKDNLPTHGNLNEYGFDFPSFLDGFERTRELPYLGDVARLECAWWRAYYAEDKQPVDPKDLANMSADKYSRIRFELHPSVRLVRSAWPVFSICHMALEEKNTHQSDAISAPASPNAAIDPDERERRAPRSEAVRPHPSGTLDINAGGEFGIVTRPHLKTEVAQLEESHLKFLVYLRSGHTIGEAYGKVLAKFKDFDLTGTLQKELKRGSFTSFQLT